MIEHGLFKRHFVGRDGFQWWIGQLPPEETWRENIAGVQSDTNQQAKGFGERYRVRILGYHTANAEDIPDEELPWAYVMYPVTAGSGGRGSSQSANLTQGTFVFGFFMDGEDGQLPVIMGVLGHNDYNEVMKNVTPTRFVPFDGYPEQDEVMGSERSTLQVRNAGGDQTVKQDNATGQPVNDQYTSSAQLNTSIKPKNDEESKEDGLDSRPLSETSECEKSPMGDIQTELQNIMKEVRRLNRLVTDARSSMAAGTQDIKKHIQNLIGKATSLIAGGLKWIFTEMEKFILNLINETSKKTYSMVFPNQREPLRKSVEQANDAVACAIRQMIDQLPDMVSGFLEDLLGQNAEQPPGGQQQGTPTKAVNIPRCFAEDFVATTLGNTAGAVTDIIDQAMGTIDSITGQVSAMVGQVMGFIENLLAVLDCSGMNDIHCQKVKEWSIFTGPGSKGGPANLTSLTDKVSQVSSMVQQSGGSPTNSGGGLSLPDIDFSGIYEDPQCDLGPRPAGPPVVEYVGDGAGAQINLVISESGEVLAGDIISSGIGYEPNTSFLNVYDDLGIGVGAVIRPVVGPVAPVPEEILAEENVLKKKKRDTIVSDDPPALKRAKNGEVIISENPQGKQLTLPSPKSGRPGDGVPSEKDKNIKEVRTVPLPKDEDPDVCRMVEFRIQGASRPTTAPIKLTFSLIGPTPKYAGDERFEITIYDKNTTIRRCVYPDRKYLITAKTLFYPESNKFFRAAFEKGVYNPDDPDNIKLRIARGPTFESPSTADNPMFDDSLYEINKENPFITGNGLWADYRQETEDGTKLGSIGPKDLQIYPNRGHFREAGFDLEGTKAIYRYKAPVLPVPPLPTAPKGIIDIIIDDPGKGYIPISTGSTTGGGGSIWSAPDDTIITGPSTTGGTLYWPPYPPNVFVGIPTGGTITIPPNSYPTEVNVGIGGTPIIIQPGITTTIPQGGTVTTPPLRPDDPDSKQPVPQMIGVPDGGFRRGPYPSASGSYPVVLYLCDLIVDKSGMDYRESDEVVIVPSMGAKATPKFDKLGRLESIKVIAGGEGFKEMPQVFIKSETGFGSRIIPKLCIDRIGANDLDRDPSLQDKLISVVDCVGRF